MYVECVCALEREVCRARMCKQANRSIWPGIQYRFVVSGYTGKPVEDSQATRADASSARARAYYVLQKGEGNETKQGNDSAAATRRVCLKPPAACQLLLAPGLPALVY